MDLGWATIRGRTRWATALGIVTALALIVGSLVALNRSVLPFGGWPTDPESSAPDQFLPEAPSMIVGALPTGGTLAPARLRGRARAGAPLARSAPIAGAGTGALAPGADARTGGGGLTFGSPAGGGPATAG